MLSTEQRQAASLEQAQKQIREGIGKAHRLVDDAQHILKAERQILAEINLAVVDPPKPPPT